jgi:5-dehydro-4-deoxyglucarate dehydratase
VPHFDDQGAFDEIRYRDHLARQADFDVAGLFTGGGTGEGFSLTSQEIDDAVHSAVDRVGSRVPALPASC